MTTKTRSGDQGRQPSARPDTTTSSPKTLPAQPVRPTTDEEEAGLDETIESSFPASDPPSTIPDPPAEDEREDR
ncbi:MAG: hypothetical protein R2712_18250 [Vicinamibacterales bacterium]